MRVTSLLTHPRITAVGGIAVVTTVMTRLIAIINTTRAFVILDGTLIFGTRRAVAGVERAFAALPLLDDLDALACLKLGRLNWMLVPPVDETINGSFVFHKLPLSIAAVFSMIS